MQFWNDVFLKKWNEYVTSSSLMQKRLNSTANALELHLFCLTHWGHVTHICVSSLIIIGSDNGLSPGRRQAII